MFWKNFCSCCKAIDKSPNAVCRELKFSTATATHWKNGSIPKGDALTKIADYFNCSIDYLLGRTFYSADENKYLCEKLIMLLNNRKSGLDVMFGTYAELPKDVLDSIRNRTHKFTNDEVVYFSEIFGVDLNENLRNNLNNNKLSDVEHKILRNFRSLSSAGQQKADEYIKDLLENPKYTVTQSPSVAHIAAEEKISTQPIVKKRPHNT